MTYENGVLSPFEGINYYVQAFQAVLDNNEHVIDYVQYDSPETYFDILVKGSTKNIDNIMYQFDTSKIYRVTNIDTTDVDYETELTQNYDEGLLVNLNLIRAKGRDWHPVHPFEVYELDGPDNFYEGLVYLFGGEKEDYMFEDTNWVTEAMEYYHRNK